MTGTLYANDPTIVVAPAIRPPSDTKFAMRQLDYLPAPELDALAARLRDEKPHFGHVRGLTIACLWKRKGGSRGDKCTLGKCAKTPALVRTYQASDFTIWLAADHCRDFALTDRQVEALLFHELLHVDLREVEVTDKVSGETVTEYRPAIAGHDLEMFSAEVEEYGLWTSELKRARETFEQATLPGVDVLAFGGAL